MTGVTSMAPNPIKEQLIERMKLDNGLVLEIYDLSRPVAGDLGLNVLSMSESEHQVLKECDTQGSYCPAGVTHGRPSCL